MEVEAVRPAFWYSLMMMMLMMILLQSTAGDGCRLS